MQLEVEQHAGKALEVESSLSLSALRCGMSIERGSERRVDGVSDHFELIFVRKGVLPIREEEQAFEVRVGQALLLWPHRHHWGMENCPSDLRFFWLRFRVREALFIDLPLNAGQTLCVPQHATVSRPDCLESLFRRYLDDQGSGRLLPSCANVLAWLMLAEVTDPRPEFDTERSVADVAARALTYIRSQCHLPITASKIAEQLGYNAEYLNRVFHQTYQRTLTEEIHQARIDRARYLLLNSSMSASDIARVCGFTDIKYFFRLFKRHEGVTPRAYRCLNVQVRVHSE